MTEDSFRRATDGTPKSSASKHIVGSKWGGVWAYAASAVSGSLVALTVIWVLGLQPATKVAPASAQNADMGASRWAAELESYSRFLIATDELFERVSDGEKTAIATSEERVQGALVAIQLFAPNNIVGIAQELAYVAGPEAAQRGAVELQRRNGVVAAERRESYESVRNRTVEVIRKRLGTPAGAD